MGHKIDPNLEAVTHISCQMLLKGNFDWFLPVCNIHLYKRPYATTYLHCIQVQGKLTYLNATSTVVQPQHVLIKYEYETLCSYMSTDVTKKSHRNISLLPEQHLKDGMENAWVFLQLSSCNVHVCLSMGYLVRSMLQATVVVILQETHGSDILFKCNSKRHRLYNILYLISILVLFSSRNIHTSINQDI